MEPDGAGWSGTEQSGAEWSGTEQDGVGQSRTEQDEAGRNSPRKVPVFSSSLTDKVSSISHLSMETSR